MKRFFKKSCIGLMLAAVLLGGSSIPASAEGNQVGMVAGHPIYDNHFGEVELHGTPESDIVKRGVNFPASYDPRKNGMVTKVEDQGMTNTCWAFATIAAIESNLIRNGYANNSLNLSENHFAYFFYNRQSDKLGYTKGDKNIAVGASWDQRGSTLMGAGVHAQTWSGVVKETTSEDDIYGMYAPRSLPAGDCYKSDYRVKNTYFYNYDVNIVKDAIMKHGAVASGIYMDMAYWDINNGAYYCPVESGNHAITIVGWDDNYNKNNFANLSTKPQNNGAWIVKNSYGTEYQGQKMGDYGYMYVSYEDKSLAEIVAFDAVKASDSYDNNYQYDGTAYPAPYQYAFYNGVSFANVFKAKASSSEVLKAVSVETFSFGVNYTLKVYTGIDESDNPESGKLMVTQSGRLEDAGYQQIKLDKPVVVQKGQKYSVVLTLSSGYADGVFVGIDVPADAGWIVFNSSVGSDQSFIGKGGYWYDFNSEFGGNLRIKAYTDDISYQLDKSLGLSKGSSTTMKIKTNNKSYLKSIKWSSSNKKVATISSKGKLKGKTYGTTTVKAQFKVGGKKKTLSCKVTVGPSKISKFKVTAGKKKFNVSWKKNSAASGYVIYYSTNSSSGFKTLKTISSNSSTKYTKSKLKKGKTYYVKMRPYKKQGSKKLYGSYTSVKKVKVK